MSDPNTPQYPQQPNPYGQPGQPSGEPPHDGPQYPPSYPQYPPQYPPQTGAQPYGAPQYPGYPQYSQGQPYAPGGYPPPQPPKRSNRALWITLSIVGGVLLVSCIACSIFAVTALRNAGSNPIIGSSLTVGLFCGYEQEQAYDQAYGQLATSLKQQVSLDQFTQAAARHDSTDGKVTRCQVESSSSGAPRVSDAQVIIPINITRSGGTISSGNVTLEKEGTGYKITALDSSLNLL